MNPYEKKLDFNFKINQQILQKISYIDSFTTEPYLVPKEMAECIEWTKTKLNQNDIHPLIIIALFIYEFLSIHPFQDGNGRLARLLTTMLLLKYGYQIVQYISFEHIIEKKKSEYYKALINGQKNRYKENERIDSWICFFLDCLEILIKKLEAKYDVYKNKGGYINKRQKDILEFIKREQPVKIMDIVTHLHKYSRNTIKKDLAYLKEEDYIEQIGNRKGSVYIMKKSG